MKQFVIIFIYLLLITDLTGQKQSTFQNPVIKGDLADPSIIRIGNTYYATGTSSEWAPFYPMYKSSDLINWVQTGHIFDKKPEWTISSFWAPELFVHNNQVYCYYTARRKSDNISCIGVATASYPTDTFTDHGMLIETGNEAIDAFVFDDNGQLYITWKAYGLDNRPIEILACKLSPDGLKLIGEPFSLLKDNDKIGMEGQYIFKKGDYYYIVYAAHGCCGPNSDYDVYVARSNNFAGPYVKYEKNPILYGGSEEFLSVGHGTAVSTPDGRMFYMCHAYMKGADFLIGRQPILQEMYVGNDNWVHFKTGNIARLEQPAPFSETIQNPIQNFEDNFNENTLKKEWTWDYVFSDNILKIDNGNLKIYSTSASKNSNRIALCLRSQSSNYSYETQVINSNENLIGLTLYGNQNNLISFGIIDKNLMLRVIKDGNISQFIQAKEIKTPIYIKIKIIDGYADSFYYSYNKKNWIKLDNNTFDHNKDLTQWDRVARPGLILDGSFNSPAEFSYFKLTNTH